jgi:hypothetical protein
VTPVADTAPVTAVVASVAATIDVEATAVSAVCFEGAKTHLLPFSEEPSAQSKQTFELSVVSSN